ncbi:MAG: hypothetical protein Q9167_002716 [Letrouitia subvulpina]
MRLPLIFWSLYGYVLTLTSATALTYKLQPNEQACFYSNAPQQGSKLAFYFAVQSGGAFDVDYSVYGPRDKLIMEGSKERQGDFVFTAKEAGEYRFCFNNEMSTFAEKMVDFEIAVENESRDAQLPSKQGTSPEQTSALEESIMKISRDLSTINRNQKYFRTRENRNFSTVKSTENRIFNFSVVESGLMVCMAGLQVFIYFTFLNIILSIEFLKSPSHTMASSPLSAVEYTSNQAAQAAFQTPETFEDLNAAIQMYTRSIHQHTKQQMEISTSTNKNKKQQNQRSKSSRRSDTTGVSQTATLSPESSVGSMDSL